jgi:hypothetical protein
MTRAPKSIDGFPVLCYTPIDHRHRPTGGCRHISPVGLLGPASGLAICGDAPDSVYLFSCDEAWVPFTDTWHESIEKAKQQAEFEYEGSYATWLPGSYR